MRKRTKLARVLFELGITDGKLAACLGISRVAVSRIKKRGIRRHQTATLYASAIGVKPENILEDPKQGANTHVRHS